MKSPPGPKTHLRVAIQLRTRRGSGLAELHSGALDGDEAAGVPGNLTSDGDNGAAVTDGSHAKTPHIELGDDADTPVLGVRNEASDVRLQEKQTWKSLPQHRFAKR